MACEYLTYWIDRNVEFIQYDMDKIEYYQNLIKNEEEKIRTLKDTTLKDIIVKDTILKDTNLSDTDLTFTFTEFKNNKKAKAIEQLIESCNDKQTALRFIEKHRKDITVAQSLIDDYTKMLRIV